MATIQTTAPVFYSNGAQGASSVVGYEGGRIRVARYSFTVPSGVSASKISVNFGQIYTGGGSPVVSFKINQDPNSYANALGFNADGAVEAYNDGGRFYARISGGSTEINAAGTYYLWLFPTNNEYGYWGWNANALSLDLTEARTYRLTLNKAAHTSLEVKRGGVSLSDGASIAYGDVLTITFGADAGYEVSATLIDDRYLPFINGVSIQSGATHIVVGNVTIATTATALGLVYIDDGTQFMACQIFIDTGSDWEQYMPYIDNGTEFELYT